METYTIYEVELEGPTALRAAKLPPMEEIRHRFAPIDHLFADLHVDAANWLETLRRHELVEAHQDLEVARRTWTAMYGNVVKRLDSFTFLLIGAGNAGKTSLVLDLLGYDSTEELNSLLRERSDFDPEHEIRIGKETTTMAVYDFHLKTIGLRLIDAPGNGGLIHANPTLGPYVDLADCVVYVASAVTSLTANDVEFLTRHVAHADVERPFHLQPGRDKTVIVAWNRWLTEYEKQPAADVDNDWRRITDWTVHGSPGSFDGLASVFSAPPLVVKTNSRRRTKAGELLPDEQLYLDELTHLIADVSARQGTSLRLKRPLQLLSRHLGELENTLRHRRLALLPCGEAMFKPVLDDMKRRSAAVRAEVHERLRHLGQQIQPRILEAFETAVEAWQPPPTFKKSLKALVPVKQWNCGVEAATKEITAMWADSFRGEFMAAIAAKPIQSLIDDTNADLLTLISTESMPDLETLPPDDLQRVSRKIQQLLTPEGVPEQSAAAAPAFGKIAAQMATLVRTCVQSAVTEQLSILGASVVMDLILAKLTLGLSMAVAGLVRWIRSGKQERAAHAQLHREGANAIRSTVATLVDDLIAAHDQMQQTIENLILEILDAESESKDERRRALLTVIDEIAAFESRVAREYDAKLEAAVA